jgi:hypothetical protein
MREASVGAVKYSGEVLASLRVTLRERQEESSIR